MPELLEIEKRKKPLRTCIGNKTLESQAVVFLGVLDGRRRREITSFLICKLKKQRRDRRNGGALGRLMLETITERGRDGMVYFV